METIKSFDDLPKQIEYETDNDILYYIPTIIKWENVASPNAYYAMYARFYPASGKTNTEQVLFSVHAGTFNEVVEKFIWEYNNMAKYVKNRKWTGEYPQIISLKNTSVDGFFKPRNVNKPKI